MKKKVLFASKNMEIGGMEKALLALLNSFDFNQYEVTLILEEKKGELLKKIKKDVIINKYKVSTFKIKIIRKAINFTHRLLWTIKNKNKYDFACCYATYSRTCNKLARIASTNNLLYVHSNYYEYYNHNEKLIKDLFNDLNINSFKKVAFVSNEAKEGIAIFYPELNDRFIVLNNIFDFKEISKLKNEPVEYTKPLNKTIFLFVGRLEEESKQVTRLINAIDKVRNVTNDFQLLIIGDGELKNEYKKIIKTKNLGNYIKMLGRKENPYPYYLMADYVVLVSNFEGFPVIYNEALYLKKPVLTTIDCSDDAINVGEDLAVIIEKNPNLISEVFIDAINKKINKKIKQVNYETINNNRINKFYEIIKEESK